MTTPHMRRILPCELALNEALPWTVYDEFGNFLLREGYIIRQQRHLDSLFARGAYVVQAESEAEDLTAHVATPAPEPRKRVPHKSAPVFIRSKRLANSLERLHADLLAGVMRNDMRMLVIGMAHVIAQACEDDADALLAGLHTNRSHSYLVVQQLLGAAVVELLAAEAGIDAPTRTSWVCAALTRDVGMIALQQQLDTQTAPLSAEQSLEIRQHPQYAESILQHMGVKDVLWIQVVREHQERCDGTGYPQQLHHEAICEGARLVAAADSYAAMVTPRPNRFAKLPFHALQDLYAQSDAAYDKVWVQRLIKSMTPFPPGSMALLQNGEKAVLRNRQPKASDMQVWSVWSAAHSPLYPPLLRHTSEPAFAVKAPAAWQPPPEQDALLQALWMQEPASAKVDERNVA